MKDKIIRGIAKNGDVRFFAAITTNLVEKASKTHGCSPVASAALGRMLTAASMMGVMLKDDKDKITLQINGGGDIGGIAAIGDSKGIVKGYVLNPNVDIPLNAAGKLDVGGAVGIDGNLTVIKDMGLKEPYIGQVPIVSGEIAEDITYYFAASEQVPSAVSLGVLVDRDMSILAAGGFIIQMMPEADDFTRDILTYRLDEIPSVTEAINKDGGMNTILDELFDGMDFQILSEYEPDFICGCSKKKVEEMLLSLGKKELQDIAESEETTEVVCHFCNKRYNFTREEIYELLKNA
jgi:molecular chaperone Hsp33